MRPAMNLSLIPAIPLPARPESESQQARTLAMASTARDDPNSYYDFQKRVTWGSSSASERSHATRWAKRIHIDRATRGDRDHCGVDRAFAARRAVGEGGGSPRPVRQQPEAARPRIA